jgi:tetratricopeptide (TPR) repeat protein
LKSKNHDVFTLTILIWAGASRLLACGPDFPNNLLDGGDAAVLTAPVLNFSRELERMKLVPARFEANPATNGYAPQTTEADLADLGAALRKAKVSPDEQERILKEYRAAREKVQKHQEEMSVWQNQNEWDWEDGERKMKAKPPAPKLEGVSMVAGLPEEFAEYFRGSLALHHGDTNEARTIWQALLERPEGERRFRSTWAAYMLGRLCAPEQSEQAISYYTKVQALARRGFVDSLGLATASLGWEAKVNLSQKQFERAIELYLQQFAAGDGSAAISLRVAAREAMAQGVEELVPLARNPRTQRVITAFVIAYGDRKARAVGEDPKADEQRQDPIKNWLDAVETAEVRDVESAEKLALAAYQSGQMEIAQRWVNRARNTPIGQWLQAKLFLRAGKIDRAATLLAQVARLFPIEPAPTEEARPASFQDNLYMDVSGYYPEQRVAAKQVLGELGVLRLARREYQESLDALLRSGYWLDAAYVAERVLTVDELKAYVDREWPAAAAAQEDVRNPSGAGEEERYSAALDLQVAQPVTSDGLSENIRYLLGRRLTRVCRGSEARAYFPTKYLASYDALMQALNTGRNESLPAETRAMGLFEAAKIARHDGMELIGTEVAPDWHVVGGNYEFEMTAGARATNEAAKVLVATKDELRRYAAHPADPEIRFHYRYQAAFIGMEAAQLMPNNSDVTARILCTAGSWLKARDPQTADLFYKALVRRCRKTALGAEADRERWFPELDEQGNLIVPVAAEDKPEETPKPEMGEAQPVPEEERATMPDQSAEIPQ